jgi:hypothetical protein
MSKIHNRNPFGRKYYEQYLSPNKSENPNNSDFIKKYPLIRPDFIDKIKQLNSKNQTEQDDAILGNNNGTEDSENASETDSENKPTLRIFLNKSNFLKSLGVQFDNGEDEQKTNGFFDEDE